mmetsp:Transcript_97145/g.274770  ORF Transcript_97145/g.274770 Transcript_97145/m.274770 type:complete len:277 (+) Transcript_97145:223-1053(+)
MVASFTAKILPVSRSCALYTHPYEPLPTVLPRLQFRDRLSPEFSLERLALERLALERLPLDRLPEFSLSATLGVHGPEDVEAVIELGVEASEGAQVLRRSRPHDERRTTAPAEASRASGDPLRGELGRHAAMVARLLLCSLLFEVAEASCWPQGKSGVVHELGVDCREANPASPSSRLPARESGGCSRAMSGLSPRESAVSEGRRTGPPERGEQPPREGGRRRRRCCSVEVAWEPPGLALRTDSGRSGAARNWPAATVSTAARSDRRQGVEVARQA